MYCYYETLRDVKRLKNKGAWVGAIGKSEGGADIPVIKVGCGRPTVIITAAIHAREWVTSRLIILQAEKALADGVGGTIYFVPVVNPDGMVLIEKGSAAFPDWERELLRANGWKDDFSLWKANARAVDLNLNFDARFGCGKGNLTTPASMGYVGKYPFSAAETRALRDFTLSIMPDATVSYHAKGRELYWFFHQTEKAKERDLRIAMRLNERLGYRLGADYTDSAGGYKDWCIEKLKIPAFTVEIGDDNHEHPLPDCVVEEEWKRNADLPQRLVAALEEL